MSRAELSPEQMGKRLGLSGMILRRWRHRTKDRPLPVLYERALTAVVSELVAEGKLAADAAEVRLLLANESALSVPAVARHLGIPKTLLKADAYDDTNVLETLGQIGSDQKRCEQVARQKDKISQFKRIGAEWKRRVDELTTAIWSPQLETFDKLIAFGALFYLVTVVDLIPDTIPVFGLVDDFGILGLAVAYYRRRFPNLFR